MNSGDIKKARLFTLLPIVVLVLVLLSFAMASILEKPTNRGTLYTIFAAATLAGIVIAPVPCSVMSLIGTVYAGKARKQNEKGAVLFFVLGIAEIGVALLGAVLAVAFAMNAITLV